MDSTSQEVILRRVTHRRPHVLLEWDSSQNKVVAAPTQVGLSWTQASANATNSTRSHLHTRLVDGFDIPEELLKLSDLNDVLTMETWETYLSESERELLSIYLPDGVDQISALQDLLGGENIHFGNPLKKWGASVCAGDIHPDPLLRKEFRVKRHRKAYFNCLRTYHGNMINNLQKMKGIWEECENRNDLLTQIQRSSRSGQTSQGNLLQHVLLPSNRNGESSNLRPRPWGEIGEDMEGKDKVMPTRPKAKRQKVNKPEEGAIKRLKIKPSDDGTKSRQINTADKEEDALTRPKAKGRKVNFVEEGAKSVRVKPSEEGTKKPKVKPLEEGANRVKDKRSEEGTKRSAMELSGNGPKRLKVKPSEEASPRQEMKPAVEGIKRLKIRPSDVGVKRQEIKGSEEESKRQQIKLKEDGTRRLQAKPSEEVTKRLKVKPSEEETRRLTIKPPEGGTKRPQGKTVEEGAKGQLKASEEAAKRLLIKAMEEGMDTATRPKSKTSKVKPLNEGIRRLEGRVSEEGTRKLQTKPPEDGIQGRLFRPHEDEDISTRPKGKRQKIRSSLEGTKRPEVNPVEEGIKKLKLKPSEDGMKRLKVKQLEEERVVSPRPKAKKQKANPSQEATKRPKVKSSRDRKEEKEVLNSDFESEWFKKYFQVTVGPVSGHKLSKAIQEVKVSRKMFKDVKIRSEAGEEVHLDSLDSVEEGSSHVEHSKKIGGSYDSDKLLTCTFWQTVVLKELPTGHANFMERRESMLELALSLAYEGKSHLQLWTEALSTGVDDSSIKPLKISDSGALGLSQGHHFCAHVLFSLIYQSLEVAKNVEKLQKWKKVSSPEPAAEDNVPSEADMEEDADYASSGGLVYESPETDSADERSSRSSSPSDME